MLQIGIIDDMKNDREVLITLLNQFFINKQIKINITEFASGEEFLLTYTAEFFQIIFLDIYMDKISGMDIAHKLFENDKNCKIIFITSSTSHATESYSVRASYYIQKPVKSENFTDALNICIKDLEYDHKFIKIKVEHSDVLILMNKIEYVDIQGRKSIIHLNDGKLFSKDTFTYISSKLLTDKRFLLCCRGVLVNMDYIKQASNSQFILKNETCIPIKQRGANAVKQQYFDYTVQKLCGEV